MRGHGESSKPDRDYTFESLIADLEALMDHLGWSVAHVVAHSWTGKLTAIWARLHPQRLKSIILVDQIFIWKIPSFLKVTFPMLYRVLPFLKGMGPFASYEQAEQQARQLNQYQGWSTLQQQVFHAGIEQKPHGYWGSKFTISARDGIFAVKIPTPPFPNTASTPVAITTGSNPKIPKTNPPLTKIPAPHPQVARLSDLQGNQSYREKVSKLPQPAQVQEKPSKAQSTQTEISRTKTRNCLKR